MIRAALLLLAICLLGAAGPVAAQSFDLDCLRGPASTTGNIKEHYQIDVAAGRWCIGECRTTKPIIRADKSGVVLEDGLMFGDTTWRYFDLTSGNLVYNFALGKSYEQHVEYACRPGPFSGLKPYLVQDPWPRGGFGGFLVSAGFIKGKDGVELQGTVGFRANIDSEGKFLSCEVTRSSGIPELDRYTCDVVSRYTAWRPAKDRNGNPVNGAYESAVRWIMPST